MRTIGHTNPQVASMTSSPVDPADFVQGQGLPATGHVNDNDAMSGTS